MAGFTPNEGETLIAQLIHQRTHVDRDATLKLGLFTNAARPPRHQSVVRSARTSTATRHLDGRNASRRSPGFRRGLGYDGHGLECLRNRDVGRDLVGVVLGDCVRPRRVDLDIQQAPRAAG